MVFYCFAIRVYLTCYEGVCSFQFVFVKEGDVVVSCGRWGNDNRWIGDVVKWQQDLGE
jgi:hypothetical protein